MIGSMADRIIEGLGGGVSIDDIMDLNNAIARSGLDNKTYMIRWRETWMLSRDG